MKHDEKRPIGEVLRFLDDEPFRVDGIAIHHELTAAAASSSANDTWEAVAAELVTPFVKKWGVLPPPSVAIVDPDPRRRAVELVVSGRWGAIAVFPSTTRADTNAQLKALQRVIGKQHRDAQEARRVQIAQWLDACGYHWRDIARAVWHRRSGVRRPTKQQVIAKLSEDEERAMMLADGGSYREAERRLYRRLRGQEAKAAAMVRVADHRYEQDLLGLNGHLAAPIAADPLSYAITVALRAHVDDDDAGRRHGLDLLKNALLGVAAPPADAPGAQK